MILYYLKKRWCQQSLTKSVVALTRLQTIFFDAYLNPDFLTRQFVYSKRFFQKRTDYFAAIQKARRYILPGYLPLLNKIEKTAEILFSLHLLRFRIQDYAIFEIGTKEMQRLKKAINESLEQIEAPVGSPDRLLEPIHEFEALYENTLSIITQNPSVILFFIRDLYSLRDILFKAADAK